MIQINKVDSLRKKREPMKYGDLNPGDCFIFTISANPSPRIRTKNGHFSFINNQHFDHPSSFTNEDNDVIIVDAEINWAFREETP